MADKNKTETERLKTTFNEYEKSFEKHVGSSNQLAKDISTSLMDVIKNAYIAGWIARGEHDESQ